VNQGRCREEPAVSKAGATASGETQIAQTSGRPRNENAHRNALSQDRQRQGKRTRGGTEQQGPNVNRSEADRLETIHKGKRPAVFEQFPQRAYGAGGGSSSSASADRRVANEVICLLAEGGSERPRDAHTQATEIAASGTQSEDHAIVMPPPCTGSVLCAIGGARGTNAGIGVAAATTAGLIIGVHHAGSRDAPHVRTPGGGDARTPGGSQGPGIHGARETDADRNHHGESGLSAPNRLPPASSVGSTPEDEDDDVWDSAGKPQTCGAAVQAARNPSSATAKGLAKRRGGKPAAPAEDSQGGSQPRLPHRLYVAAGFTPGCKGCNAARSGKLRRQGHTYACKQRVAGFGQGNPPDEAHGGSLASPPSREPAQKPEVNHGPAAVRQNPEASSRIRLRYAVHGYTPNCKGCNAVRNRRRHQMHTPHCKDRIARSQRGVLPREAPPLEPDMHAAASDTSASASGEGSLPRHVPAAMRGEPPHKENPGCADAEAQRAEAEAWSSTGTPSGEGGDPSRNEAGGTGAHQEADDPQDGAARSAGANGEHSGEAGDRAAPELVTSEGDPKRRKRLVEVKVDSPGARSGIRSVSDAAGRGKGRPRARKPPAATRPGSTNRPHGTAPGAEAGSEAGACAPGHGELRTGAEDAPAEVAQVVAADSQPRRADDADHPGGHGMVTRSRARRYAGKPEQAATGTRAKRARGSDPATVLRPTPASREVEVRNPPPGSAGEACQPHTWNSALRRVGTPESAETGAGEVVQPHQLRDSGTHGSKRELGRTGAPAPRGKRSRVLGVEPAKVTGTPIGRACTDGDTGANVACRTPSQPWVRGGLGPALEMAPD